MKAITQIGDVWVALNHVVRVTQDRHDLDAIQVLVYTDDGSSMKFTGDDAQEFLDDWSAYIQAMPHVK